METVEVPTVSILLGFFLSFLALCGASNYAGQEKASESVVVVGKVFCDKCLEHRLSENGYVISGASIAVECGLNRKTMSLSIIGETDENGEFKVELPSTIFQSADQLNNCRVRPRISPYDSSCRIPLKSPTTKLTLQSDSDGVLTYSAGSFSYRQETVPPSCYREDFLTTMKKREMAENVEQSSKSGQQTPTILSLPQFSPAILPNLPPLPSFGIPPLPTIPLPKNPALPNFGFPPLPNIPNYFGFPPLPTIPPLPKIPSLPSIPTLPSISPLPKLPPLPSLSFPPFPKPSIPGFPPFPQVPPFPQIPNIPFPPNPFLSPPPASN